MEEGLLDRQVGVIIIGLMQRYRQAHGFQVVPPPARGTGVDEHIREAPAQLAPEAQVAFDIADLGDTLPVRRVVLPPAVQRIDVEILPVEIDALFAQDAADMLEQPVKSLRIAEIEQTGAGQQPFGCCSASHEPAVTRSGSNQTSVFIPFVRA